MEEVVSKQIADALGIQLTGEEGERLAKRYTDNVEVHEAYLNGRMELAKFTIDATRKAIQYFEEAIAKDPDYALAYLELARCYIMLGQPLGAMPHREAMPKAKELAMKALEIDDKLGAAHARLAYVKAEYEWQWEEAENEYKLALELDPSAADTYQGYAFLLGVMGRFDEAISMTRRGIELNPLSLGYRTSLGQNLYNSRRYEGAIEQLQAVIEINPDYQRAYGVLTWPYETMGMYREAAAAWQKQQILGGASEEAVAGLSAAADLGSEAYWRWKLDFYTEKAQQEYVSPSTFYIIYAALDEKDRAFEWLEKAYEARQGGNFTGLRNSPKLDNLRDDPRFHDLLRRMNLEP